ncbi:FG-GAP repeat protein [Candidatus Sumerlaeota bacterium]|nr:FG-GAP repeat protein [Candidatus Sumerlaeota bacterium]
MEGRLGNVPSRFQSPSHRGRSDAVRVRRVGSRWIWVVAALCRLFWSSRSIAGAAECKLTASDGAAGDGFGVSLAFSGDCAAVGAHLNDAFRATPNPLDESLRVRIRVARIQSFRPGRDSENRQNLLTRGLPYRKLCCRTATSV